MRPLFARLSSLLAPHSSFVPIEHQGMVASGVGDSHCDFAVKNVGEQVSADFGTPPVRQPGTRTGASGEMPADQMTKIGRRPDELFGEVAFRTKIRQREPEKLAEDLLVQSPIVSFGRRSSRQFGIRNTEPSFNALKKL